MVSVFIKRIYRSSENRTLLMAVYMLKVFCLSKSFCRVSEVPQQKDFDNREMLRIQIIIIKVRFSDFAFSKV